MSAVDKIKRLQEDMAGKTYVDKEGKSFAHDKPARAWAAEIFEAPRDRWDELIESVPADVRATAQKFLIQWRDIHDKIVMPHVLRIEKIKGVTKDESIELRRRALERVPLPNRGAVEREVRKRFEARRSAARGDGEKAGACDDEAAPR
jgi:hypothetical protein